MGFSIICDQTQAMNYKIQIKVRVIMNKLTVFG